MDYEDPGWTEAIKRTLFPYSTLLRLRRKTGNQIVGMRMIYLGIVTAAFLIGFVLSFIVPSNRWFDRGERTWFLFVVAGIGLLCLLRIDRLRRRPLDASDRDRLADTYQASLFIGIGCAEAPLLAGFIGSFVTHTLWIYLVALAPALIGFLLIAPSRHEIARRQEQIASQGSSLSLGSALMEARPKPKRR
jgi:MFS family permease